MNTKKIIFAGHDAFEHVQIIDNEDKRILTFDQQQSQSEMSVSDPFALVMEYCQEMALALLFKPQPKKVLFLGLGGGSLPKFFWHYFPYCECDVVERSQLIIDLSQQYFHFPKDARTKVFCEDALTYVRKCSDQYDIIMLDLFQGNGMSELIQEPDFFKHCYDLLKNSKGILVWNTWKIVPKEVMETCIFYLCRYFGDNMLILPTSNGGNHIFMIFTEKMDPKANLPVLMQEGKLLTQKTGLDFLQLYSENDFFL